MIGRMLGESWSRGRGMSSMFPAQIISVLGVSRICVPMGWEV